jgi:hypothetical protein
MPARKKRYPKTLAPPELDTVVAPGNRGPKVFPDVAPKRLPTTVVGGVPGLHFPVASGLHIAARAAS